MSSPFQWILEIVDKASGPSKKATESLGAFEKEMHKVEQRIHAIKASPIAFKGLQHAKQELRELTGGSKSFAEKVEEMGAAVKRVGFVQNLMLGAEALHLGFEAAEKLADVVLDIGKEMIDAAGHAERFKLSFQAMLGGEGAEEVLGYIEKIEEHTELSGAQLKGLSAELLKAGFSAKELGNALPAALDIAGFSGGGIEHVQAAIEALSKIRESGKFSSKTLMHLGLGENAEEGLFKRMSGDTGKSVAVLKKQLEAGKLDPKLVLQEVYKTIMERQRGDLGTTAEKMTDTVQSKIKKLKELPERLFEKWADTPGFVKFSEALTKILEKLDPAGPNGKKLFAALDTASMKVVELVGKFADGTAIDSFVDTITKIPEYLTQIPPILDKVITVSEVLAAVWVGSKIVGVITAITGALPGLALAAGGATGAIGAMAAPLLAVAAAAFAVYEAISKINKTTEELGGAKAVGRDLVDIGKPAAESQGNAGYAAYEDERKRNIAIARDQQLVAMMSAAASPAANDEAAIPSQASRVQTGGRSLNQNAHVELHIDARGSNPDEVGDAVNQTLPGAMQQGFERMAVASGAL